MSRMSLLGQERPWGVLSSMYSGGRVGSSYLFWGQEGVGKRTAAELFFTLLNCASPVQDAACGQCPHCRKYGHRTHPDARFLAPVDGKYSIGIEDIRLLHDWFYRKPLEGRWKQALIDECQLLSVQASNALLKLLEEPPSYGIIVLTASDIQRVIPTIRSRCQKLYFSGLPDEAVIEICRRQGYLCENVGELALYAGGSMRRALLYADEEWNDARQHARIIENTLEEARSAGVYPEAVMTAMPGFRFDRTQSKRILECMIMSQKRRFVKDPSDMRAKRLRVLIDAYNDIAGNCNVQLVWADLMRAYCAQ